MDAIVLHLAWLEQRGLARVTVYHRARYLNRLGTWLECYGGERSATELQAGPLQGYGLEPSQGGESNPATSPQRDAVDVIGVTTASPILTADRADLLAWRATLTGLAPASILAAVSHVNEFYRWAAVEHLIDVNPATRIPVPKRPRGLPRPIADDTLMRVLAAAPQPIRLQLVLAGWLGLRACELAGLERENILDTIPGPLLIVSASSAKGGRERVIPLSPWVVAEVHAAGLPVRGFVFGEVTPHTVSQKVNRYLRAQCAGATLHQLRHRALSQAWRGSKDLLAVARLAGHANVATTTVYTKLDDSAVVAAVLSIPVPGDRLRLVSGE